MCLHGMLRDDLYRILLNVVSLRMSDVEKFRVISQWVRKKIPAGSFNYEINCYTLNVINLYY